MSSLPRDRVPIHQWHPADAYNESLKKLVIGTRPVRVRSVDTPAEHWAIKIGEWWIEVGGEGGKTPEQGLFVHTRDDDYKTVEERDAITTATYEEIRDWCIEWLEDHPTYRVNGDNCQLFVKHALHHFSRTRIDTQNAQIGGSMMFWGRIGALIGLAAVGVGALIQGTHSREREREPSEVYTRKRPGLEESTAPR